MTKKIIIGSRGSKLALLYAQKAKEAIIKNSSLNDWDIVIKSITTKGDQVKDSRLSEFGGKGLFSSNIEKELQEKLKHFFLCVSVSLCVCVYNLAFCSKGTNLAIRA